MRLRAAVAFVLVLAVAGCTAPLELERESMAAYRRALHASDPERRELLREGGPGEAEAMARFVDFYREYTPAHVRAHVREVYAEDAFFRDAFREVQGIDAIEEYFTRAAESADVVRFQIESVAESSGNYYIRWVMKYQATRDTTQPLDEALGFSHVRFDPSGKVVFQQDYMDPARAIYEKVPLLGWILYKIRSRF